MSFKCQDSDFEAWQLHLQDHEAKERSSPENFFYWQKKEITLENISKRDLLLKQDGLSSLRRI